MEGVLRFGRRLRGDELGKERRTDGDAGIAQTGTDEAGRDGAACMGGEGVAVPARINHSWPGAQRRAFDRDDAEGREGSEVESSEFGDAGSGSEFAGRQKRGDDAAAREAAVERGQSRTRLGIDVEDCEDKALIGGANPGAAAERIDGPEGAAAIGQIMPARRAGGRAEAFFVAVHHDAEAGGRGDDGECAHREMERHRAARSAFAAATRGVRRGRGISVPRRFVGGGGGGDAERWVDGQAVLTAYGGQHGLMMKGVMKREGDLAPERGGAGNSFTLRAEHGAHANGLPGGGFVEPIEAAFETIDHADGHEEVGFDSRVALAVVVIDDAVWCAECIDRGVHMIEQVADVLAHGAAGQEARGGGEHRRGERGKEGGALL